MDRELMASFWEYCNRLKRAGVVVIALTSHYVYKMQRCDKAGLDRQNRLIAEGTPGDLVKRTNTTNLYDAFLSLAGHQVET